MYIIKNRKTVTKNNLFINLLMVTNEWKKKLKNKLFKIKIEVCGEFVMEGFFENFTTENINNN